MAPGGTLGRPQNTRSTLTAARALSRSTSRVNRSSFAKTSLAPETLACAKAAVSLGRSIALAAFHLDIPFAAVQVALDRRLLSFEAKLALALLVT